MIDILFVPSVKRGNGSGHLSRCLGLAAALGQRAAVYLADEPGADAWSSGEIRLAYSKATAQVRIVGELSPEARFGLVVLDQRETCAEELSRWAAHGAVAALDEGGAARSGVEYLIDVLPRIKGAKRDRANISSLGFLDLPKARRPPPAACGKVLVSFGGEDPAGLTAAFVESAVGGGVIAADKVTVVAGALSSSIDSYEGVTAIGPVQNLKEQLKAYDLVVTMFGLTAFEAAWAGCAVLLVNPSTIHERLAREAGFVSLGVGKPKSAKIAAAIANLPGLAAAASKAAPAERLDLGAAISALAPRNSGACPCCGVRTGDSIYRTVRKTYLKCPECGLVRMASFVDRPNPYVDPSYFDDEYKAQYGRTYIEDLPSIRESMRRRLEEIESLLPGSVSGRTALDVGCAYGAFLSEAQAKGWNAVGSDLSPSAVKFVKTTLGIPAFVADFAEPGSSGLYPTDLSCLTMWYVIEHFEDLGRALRKAASLLLPGAVFAFSTPSIGGVSAKKDMDSFLERSPDDHYTVWDPSTAPDILKRFGFSIQKIIVTGHHPERFPGVPDDPGSLRYSAALGLSRFFGLGDTFECYALRVAD